MFSRSVVRPLAQRHLAQSSRLPLLSSKRTLFSIHILRQSNVTPVRLCARNMSTPPPILNVSELSMDRYHALSDSTMITLLESLENILDDAGNPEYEVDYHSGVLTLNLGKDGTYVINKQPPNKQIWLSSPSSGPKRYDYDHESDDWRYLRDGRSLGGLLEEELGRILGQTVQIKVQGVSEQIQ